MVRERRLPSGAAPCECATEETPWGVSDVWQMQDLESAFLDLWQWLELRENSRMCGKERT